MKNGSIPKRLKVFIRPKKTITFRWDDIEVDDDTYEIEAFPAFVTDIENKKTQSTAKNWTTYSRSKSTPPKPFDIDNDRFVKDVRIIGLSIRSKGGRAWQVLINNEYVFDMREDVLMDSILCGGVKKGGLLKGEFIFAVVNSEMKIIRKGSLLHKKMITSTEFSKKDVITDLKVGGVYKSKTETKVYLGVFWTSDIVCTNSEEFSLLNPWLRTSEIFGTKRLMFKQEKSYKVHVFTDYDNGKFKKEVKYYRLSLYKNKPKSFKEEIKIVKFDINKYLNKVKACIVESKDKYSHRNQFWLTLSGYSPRLNLIQHPHPHIHKALHDEVHEFLENNEFSC